MATAVKLAYVGKFTFRAMQVTTDRKRPDNSRPLIYVLFKKYGIKQALLLVKQDVLFDIIHRVDTFRSVSNKSLFNPSQWAEHNRYVPTTFALMESILAHMNQWINFNDCEFLDMGSGKGKALIAAARQPFRKLTGVEISERLHDIANSNLRILQLDDKIELINSDARDFSPNPDQRVIYFFNPFTGSVLHSTLQNIKDCSTHQQRYIACANPTENHVFEQYFDKVDAQYFEPGHCEVNFYTTR